MCNVDSVLHYLSYLIGQSSGPYFTERAAEFKSLVELNSHRDNKYGKLLSRAGDNENKSVRKKFSASKDRSHLTGLEVTCCLSIHF